MYTLARSVAFVGLFAVAPAIGGVAFAKGAPQMPSDYAMAVSLTNTVKSSFQKMIAKPKALREYKRFLRSHAQAKKDWKQAKKKNGVGIIRLANGLTLVGDAIIWFAAIVAPSPVTIGLATATTAVGVNTARNESKLRAQLRTETIGRALARGDGPSAEQMTRWEKAGIMLHVSR